MKELSDVQKAFENLVDHYEQNISLDDLKVGYQHRNYIIFTKSKRNKKTKYNKGIKPEVVGK